MLTLFFHSGVVRKKEPMLFNILTGKNPAKGSAGADGIAVARAMV
jgi:hypothetical protein